MILDALYIAGAIMLNIIVGLFSAINYVMPQQILDALTYFAAYLNYAQGIWPIQTLLLQISALCTFFAFFYGIKLILWAISMLPIIGKQSKLPNVSTRK